MTETDLVGSVLSQQGWPTSTPFFLVIDREKSNEEKCLVTEVNGFDLTMTRGQDGTIPRPHSVGAIVEHCFTALDARESNEHNNAEEAVHGLPVGSDVVGTTSTQTLTGKTLDFAAGTGNIAANIPATASPELQAEIQGLSNSLATETSNRVAGDQTNATAITTETTNRTNADAAHVAAADPHAQYLTQAEGDALFLTQAEADALFLTPAEGDALFLTPAEGDAAYARYPKTFVGTVTVTLTGGQSSATATLNFTANAKFPGFSGANPIRILLTPYGSTQYVAGASSLTNGSVIITVRRIDNSNGAVSLPVHVVAIQD
jgi:hypothetical protein